MTPVLTIERCKGVVVKKENQYGLIDVTGKELVPIAVDNIYEIENAENEDNKYFMLYHNEELNIIERLIVAGLLEEDTTTQEEQENHPTTANNEIVNTTVNTVEDNTMNNME